MASKLPCQMIMSDEHVTEASRLLLLAEAEARPGITYTTLLQQAGYEVVVVPHDEAGLAARKTNPAVIILQLIDPAISGLGLVREFRMHADTRGTPVIVLVRFDDAHTREQIVRAGATAILIEPVKPPMLLRQLRRLIARRSLVTRAASVTSKTSGDAMPGQPVATGTDPRGTVFVD
jgi:DNA-binding response OmpR family regulator